MDTVLEAPAIKRQGRPHKSLWLLLSGIATLLLAGLAVALIGTRQSNAAYPLNSPAAAVQRYLVLLQNGQVDKAYAVTNMHTSRQNFHNRYDNWSQSSHKVTLVHSRVHGRYATVTVDMSYFSAGPFGSSDSTSRMTFELARHGKGWRITGPDFLPY